MARKPYTVRVAGYVPGGAPRLRFDTLRVFDAAMLGWRLEVTLSRVPYRPYLRVSLWRQPKKAPRHWYFWKYESFPGG